MGLRKEIRAVLLREGLTSHERLGAIAILLDAKIEPTKPVKPVFQVDVSDTDDGKIKVTIDRNAKKLRADHLMAAAFALTEFAEAKPEGCKCADHCGGPAK